MSLRGRQGWIFDLDGTLALPVHDFDGLREALGLPPGVLILEYLASRPAAEAKTLGARLEALEAELITECRPQPGIRDALEGLRNRGGAWAWSHEIAWPTPISPSPSWASQIFLLQEPC